MAYSSALLGFANPVPGLRVGVLKDPEGARAVLQVFAFWFVGKECGKNIHIEYTLKSQVIVCYLYAEFWRKRRPEDSD